jgi:hypothetical protein
MVFVIDQGSVFDAPVDKVWKYVNEANTDQHSHTAMRNVQFSMDGEHPVLSFETEGPGGMKFQQKMKMTMVPPVGFLTEYIDGPLKGSKSMQFYHPMGDKTGVTVVGEFVSSMLPENQIHGVVMQQLETAFNEDQANIKKFQ